MGFFDAIFCNKSTGFAWENMEEGVGGRIEIEEEW